MAIWRFAALSGWRLQVMDAVLYCSAAFMMRVRMRRKQGSRRRRRPNARGIKRRLYVRMDGIVD